MSPENIIASTAHKLSKALEKGEVNSVSICQAFLDRIDSVDSKIGAFLSIEKERILDSAKASDERRASGQALSKWDGIPIALKDVIAVEGEPLTCASKILSNFVSPYDATVTSKLKATGWIPFGRLNMDEFAMGSSTENSSVKPAHNPWNLDYIPGGSSGGSAASVAARECPVSLGSDTGGSIRQPAALCGVVGFKPSYGRISRYGLAAFASSLDQIGPLAHSVDDVALLFEILSGIDPKDSTSAPNDLPDLSDVYAGKPLPQKIGLPKEYFTDGIDAETKAAVDQAAKKYQEAGCEIVEISLPHTKYAVSTYYIIATAEASSNLSRYDGIRYGKRSEKAEDGIDLYFKSRGEGFGSEVKRRIVLGTYVLSSGYYDAWYLQAQKVRAKIRNDFIEAFKEVDTILTPTTPSPAFKIGEKSEDPLEMYLADIFTISVNLAGLPAISLPCGLSSDRLPIGLQLIGKPFGEKELLQTAKWHEILNPFTEKPQD